MLVSSRNTEGLARGAEWRTPKERLKVRAALHTSQLLAAGDKEVVGKACTVESAQVAAGKGHKTPDELHKRDPKWLKIEC